MTIEGAVVQEQGIKFAIVVVKQHVLRDSHSAHEAATSFSHYFPGLPVVLMAQDFRGTPTYLGRRDIVNFLAKIQMSRIPWKKYSFA